jgi:predicted ester cyclase
VEAPLVVRTYVEKFTAPGLDRWVTIFAPDGTYSDTSTPEPIPCNRLKEYLTGFFAGFPDARFETVGLDSISDDVWVWRWVLHATNTGSYRGLPVTGRSLTLPGVEFIEIRGDQVYKAEGYFDRLSMLVQLGLAPAPVSRPTG